MGRRPKTTPQSPAQEYWAAWAQERALAEERVPPELFERVLDRAAELFEDRDLARGWLHKCAYGLGGRKPIDSMQTEDGAREVEALLGRIEHGVYS